LCAALGAGAKTAAAVSAATAAERIGFMRTLQGTEDEGCRATPFGSPATDSSQGGVERERFLAAKLLGFALQSELVRTCLGSLLRFLDHLRRRRRRLAWRGCQVRRRRGGCCGLSGCGRADRTGGRDDGAGDHQVSTGVHLFHRFLLKSRDPHRHPDQTLGSPSGRISGAVKTTPSGDGFGVGVTKVCGDPGTPVRSWMRINRANPSCTVLWKGLT